MTTSRVHAERQYGRVGVLVLVGACLAACGSAAPADTAPDAGSAHGAHEDPLAHCKAGYRVVPDPRDAVITSTPLRVLVRGGGTPDPADDVHDVLLPDEVSDWMYEQGWQQQHDDWHNIRRWDQACRKSEAPAAGCVAAERLLARGLWRAAIQEGAAGDGYDFLVMHRHMLRTIRQTFPAHAALFDGFKVVPRSKDDPANPNPDVSVRWSPNQLAAIETLEAIEQHLDRFPTEDDLALYMEAPFKWTTQSPNLTNADASSGIHFGLHAQWSIAGSPAPLGNGQTNVENFVFWKLHGWLDDVWERYRKAKGIGEDSPKYQAALQAQCEEMHRLDSSRLVIPGGSSGNPDAGVATETGAFAVKLRPIFDAKCGTCHGTTGASGGLTLVDPFVTSAQIIATLVGQKASSGDYDLVTPGAPERSWLYMKAAGTAASATCTAVCNRSPMPPAGAKMTAEELAVLRDWITSGAGLD